nr:ADM_HP1_G0039340.mRNA.1.CDS.1 [Saccharomyces cerevisiae]
MGSSIPFSFRQFMCDLSILQSVGTNVIQVYRTYIEDNFYLGRRANTICRRKLEGSFNTPTNLLSWRQDLEDYRLTRPLQ